MEELIKIWQDRQKHYEDLAIKHLDNAHNNRKFTYKAMATRDCWKELALQLHKTNVSNQCLHENTTHQKLTCNVCLDCNEIIETDV